MFVKSLLCKQSDVDEGMDVLYDMFTPPSGGVLDENHLMQREDPTKIVLRYQDPAELPDSLSPQVYRMIARCLKEYTAMLLWREALAEELKDTWLELIYTCILLGVSYPTIKCGLAHAQPFHSLDSSELSASPLGCHFIKIWVTNQTPASILSLRLCNLNALSLAL